MEDGLLEINICFGEQKSSQYMRDIGELFHMVSIEEEDIVHG